MQSQAASLRERFLSTRGLTLEITAPLETEDFVIQSMPDVSPPKWHLGHTTWFFEYLILLPFQTRRKPFFPEGSVLFNSYYEGLGSRVARPSRGHLSRPTVQTIIEYRNAITEGVLELLEGGPDREDDRAEVHNRIEIGIQHEQQHQELLLTDIKHILWQNVPRPVYMPPVQSETASAEALSFSAFDGGLVEFGAEEGFSYDNERPRHRFYCQPFEIGNRLVTNGEYLAFMEDGAYRDFRHWLSDGWDLVRSSGWDSPLYWENRDGEWWEFTLHGNQQVVLDAAVTHLSFHEAWAFAKWSGCRLPTEYEWELAAGRIPRTAAENLLGRGRLHPAVATSGQTQMFGDCWEWTSSAYLPYPGFESMRGPLEEYNGKFMNDRRVLRGGSCVTPADHIRLTYRNFFQGDKRWQFSGLRMAR